MGSIKSQDAESIAKMILSTAGREIPVASEKELETMRDVIFIETIYSYLALKTFIDCGQRSGLSEQQSRYIAGQVLTGALRTVLGADAKTAELLQKSGREVSLLNKGKKLGQQYGFQATMEKAMAVQ